MAMASLAGSGLSPDAMKRADNVQDNLLLYDEHTFGAYNSISEPMCENALLQWGQKSSYVWSAVLGAGMLREEALGVLEPGLSRGKTPRRLRRRSRPVERKPSRSASSRSLGASSRRSRRGSRAGSPRVDRGDRRAKIGNA